MRSLSLALVFSTAAVASAFDDFTPAFNASTPSHRRLAADVTCSIQSGVDFVGNDIGSAPGASATDCCAKCGAQSGCGAYTWTSYNGGTCWLKSSKGSVVANANAKSAIVSASSSGTCAIEAGVDYAGNDIGNVPGASASECCAKCGQNSQCNAFTWTGFNGGTCWLKSGKGATTTNADAVSGVVSSASGSCSVPEQNVDYVGNDIGSVAGSASECCPKCSQRSGCGAYTWTNFNGGTCWLKSGKGTTKASDGAVSGVVKISGSSVAPSNHVQWRIRSGSIPIRSVNLGGWLVGEYWMSFTSPAWTDTNGRGWDGEYLTMQYLGKDKGTRQFEQHRQTWITEADIQQIAAAGMNTVRVPVGFWIVNDDPAVPSTDISRTFAAGGLKYLDRLINEWAMKYNLAVMLSLHAHQGAQNPYDHSSPQIKGTATWSTSRANVDNSLQFSTYLAARYKNSPAFLGMNLMNEPSFPTDYNVLWGYYKEAYARIRGTGNDCILVVSPMLQEQGPPVMMNFMRWPEYNNVWHEFHVYYKWGYEGKNEYQVIDAARPYRSNHLDNWSGNYIYMGEWSLAHPDEAPFRDRNLLKQFAAIQLQNYEGAHSGWAFWSWRHDEETKTPETGLLSGWSMRQLLREGIFSVPRVN